MQFLNSLAIACALALSLGAGADIVLGFFNPQANVFGDANFQSIVPDFGTFAADSVPEAGASLYIGMGLLGLFMLGRTKR